MPSFWKALFLTTCAAVLCACSPLHAPSGEDTAGQDSARKLPDGVKTCCINPDRHKAPPGPPEIRSIRFEYDSSSVNAEFMPLIEAHARYLREYKSRHITLTGHTDERGSREYNLALGMTRAEQVRRAFLILGVEERQIDAISYGEEQPQNTGSDEAAWAENRRVEIRYD